MKKIYVLLIALTLCFITSCKSNLVCKLKGHDFVKVGCLEKEKCNRCGKTSDKISEHDIKITIGEQPQCTKEGLSNGKICSFCQKVIEEQTIIPPLGHHWILENNILKCEKCHQNATKEDEVIYQIENTISNQVANKLELPTMINDYPIIWQSTDYDKVLDDGTIVLTDEQIQASMIAKVEKLNYEKEFTFTIMPNTISLGVYDIAYNFYVAKLNKVISRNVSLLTSDYNGCQVQYISQNEDIISSTGKINQTKEEQNAIMNIYVIKDGLFVLYPVEVKIASFTPSTRIQAVKNIINEEIEKFRKGEIDQLPIYNEEYEVSIKWISNRPEFIMTDTIKLTPLEKTNLKLKAELTYEKSSSVVEYELNNIGGLISEQEFYQELIKYISQVKLKGSINHLHKEYQDELFLDYQERINSYGVLNLTNATLPSVNRDYIIDTTDPNIKNLLCNGLRQVPTQQQMNEIFYNGYQLTNDANVLFITVHESAMTNTTDTAQYLAQIQHEFAFERENPREASWHYQVDAYSIYQSYEDNIACWHAGETYGNRYGIGIEMCVNQGGNYEGTLANNAKLVASLLLKYNLDLNNVYRHYDHSQKECPSYLIRTNRWYEFLQMVTKEYLVQKYLNDVTIKYELSTDEYQTTNEVLDKYFIKGANNLYYNIPVTEKKSIKMKVSFIKNAQEYNYDTSFMLLPDTKE